MTAHCATSLYYQMVSYAEPLYAFCTAALLQVLLRETIRSKGITNKCSLLTAVAAHTPAVDWQLKNPATRQL
jgi:hypothetical protein